ncbi:MULTISPECIES: IlvD/Edd family dehydratase [unclassified Streptomyces]|uniref:IlvD/Edd family dehydratase n=1 Tax=unclassified Streptomyces TaxID=2593676 RepID=UPI0033EA8FCD
MSGTTRSQQWYAGDSRDAFIHRAWMRRGLPDHAFDGRPQIVICNTWSDLTPCNGHFREIAEHVKRGVWESGGVPLELPVPSLGETLLRPTAMFFRDLAAMVVEELIRGNPVDGVVLLGGCDKTVPSLLLGAASVDLPTLMVTGGPMLNGSWKGRALGCGTGVWEMSEEVRAGRMPRSDLRRAESAMIRSRGHCNTMGTASTMACVAEALGMTLPGNAGLPAPDSRLLELSHAAGNRIVEMVAEDLRPSAVLTREALLNAVRAVAAIGGSTNAVVHLLALARRVGADFGLDDIDRAGRDIPLLADVQPAGSHLMEDFHRAGGLDAVLGQIRDHLEESVTVSGRPLTDQISGRASTDLDVIRTADEPIAPQAGLAVLRGNLCPDGAVIKPAAATPELLRHRGRAVVFDGIEDFHARIDDPELAVDASDVLVLRGCGPRGYPGMPEVGNMPLPRKVLETGVRDMVRISDARMSGTAFGTVVLHIAPESAAGGPLGLVRTGDWIELDVERRMLRLDMPDEELAARQPVTAAAPPAESGWERVYREHVEQADQGAGLDFLAGTRGSFVARESH